MLARLKHFFNWAIAEGLTDHHPFKRHGVTVIKMDTRVEQARTRRLHEGEEARLLEHAGPFLHALVIAAVDTGCRLNEMLGLQWKDVFFEQNIVLLHGDKTKTYESRDVPITARLKAVLQMRRTGPDGKELPPTAYVFGNEVGERRRSIRTAWAKTLKRAKITGLRFHDLRREFGSRLLESGASAHVVRDWLGHADITTTSRYLATTRVALQKALKQFEEHRAAKPAKEKTPPATTAPSEPATVN
jgi:integrase